MRQSLVSALIHTLGNAVGLALAALLITNFKLGLTAFIVAVLLFTLLELILRPLILKLTRKNLPALEGGIALVTTFAGLILTSLLVNDMSIGGIRNWVLATLLVWIGALVAGAILPRFVFPQHRTTKAAKR